MQHRWAVESAGVLRLRHGVHVLMLLAAVHGCGGHASDGDSDAPAGQAPSRVRPVTIAVRPTSPVEAMSPPGSSQGEMPIEAMSIEESCADNPFLDPCPLPEEPVVDDLLTTQTSAQYLLLAYCGTCHGPQLDEGAGGIGFIDDWDALTERGLIIPCDSDGSPIIESMRSGAMPPSGTLGRPRRSDIEAVALAIDEDCAAP